MQIGKAFFTRVLPYRLIEKIYGPEALPDSAVQENYFEAGTLFGDDVSYIALGECIGFEEHLNDWAKWETEYVRRGYRTVSLDDFIEAGGYGKPIEDLLGQKRNPEEEPVIHAEIYRNVFLGRIQPQVDMGEIMESGEVRTGTYILPSTDKTS